jgi:ADP-ribosylglycohydrolase
MRYPPLARWQGGLSGSLVGELLLYDLTTNRINQKYWQRNLTSNSLTNSTFTYLKNRVIQKLINCGQLKVEDWQEIIYLSKSSLSFGEFMVLTLPIAFYYHENLSLLRKQLEIAFTSWQNSTALLDEVWFWYEAIALGFQERIQPQPLKQILNLSSVLTNPLREKLELLQTAIDRGTGLERVVFSLTHCNRDKVNEVESTHNAIALALYCFACTPEDFTLAVNRAVQIRDRSPLTAVFTGAISGVYNGISNIPGDRYRFSETELQAQLLFASWAGATRVERSQILEQQAIAASSFIQTRSSLKIISQKE